MRTTMRCAHPQPDRATTLIRKPGCRHISHLHWHCARGLATQFAFWFCVTSMLACFYCATFVIARCRHAIANPTPSVCLSDWQSVALVNTSNIFTAYRSQSFYAYKSVVFCGCRAIMCCGSVNTDLLIPNNTDAHPFTDHSRIAA